ncbi:hypothetical protein [Desulfosporosinus sp. Sb-LF]|uniref:hypothetical protein n=1 Tax=Desulfosporosinus sp. Sb-LF TaxID=2560027 RepID=UPI00107F406C|nr:hypothetical protein [Desulfosporosinus sp. Sb-LF]TGE32874.1 hypothetical protein E4K68_08475 [Desulfosporosinus sp. Sb-LF]
MSQIPVKFRIVQVISQIEGVSNQQILGMLKIEYPLDRSVHEKGVEDYLLTLKAVGLIELTNVTLNNKGKLKQYYKITDYGASRMKYIS